MTHFLNVESMTAKPQTWSDDYHTYVLLSQEKTTKQNGMSEEEEEIECYICNYIQYTHEEFQEILTSDLKEKVILELDMSLDTVRYNKIQESKELLESYYKYNPLFSTVHKEEGEYYAVTSEKQNYLMAMITLCDQSTALGVEFQPTWNASGEPCEPWTVTELKQLSLQIAQFVYPAVSKQQTYEKLINTMTDVNEIRSLVIDYASTTETTP